MKQRKHSTTEAHKFCELRRKICTEKFEIHSNEWHAEYVLLELQEILDKGLCECYNNFTDMLFDLYPNFSWKPEELISQVKLVLVDSRFDVINKGINETYDFDMQDDFRKAIVNAKENIYDEVVKEKENIYDEIEDVKEVWKNRGGRLIRSKGDKHEKNYRSRTLGR